MLYESAPSTEEDIGKEWMRQLAEKKRVGKQRVQMINGRGSGYGGQVPVLSDNMYDLESGEGSIFDRELRGDSTEAYRDGQKKQLRAGRDYGHDDW